jgi:hypothetical protein
MDSLRWMWRSRVARSLRAQPRRITRSISQHVSLRAPKANAFCLHIRSVYNLDNYSSDEEEDADEDSDQDYGFEVGNVRSDGVRSLGPQSWSQISHSEHASQK